MIGGFNALFDGRPNRGCGDHQRQTESHLTSYSPKCVFARAHKLTSSIRDYQFLLDSVSSSVPQGACSALIQATFGRSCPPTHRKLPKPGVAKTRGLLNFEGNLAAKATPASGRS